VTPQDAVTKGVPALYGYGHGFIAEKAGKTRKEVSEAIRQGHLDPACPLDVARWIAKSRGFAEVAEVVGSLRDVGHD
jgi:hypothetical protein